MPTQSKFFVTCPKGLEDLLYSELQEIGINQLKQTVAGVNVQASLSDAYRICLWSRLANRVLLPVSFCEIKSAEDLYQACYKIPWTTHLHPSGSLLVDFNGKNNAITHTHFGALKVKDAIVDHFRDKTGKRPTVAKTDPMLRVNAHLRGQQLTISIDLSGESLHKRQYRQGTGPAPLKENLAAALLYRAKWPKLAAEGKALIDPMCGTATLLTEAAMMAADIAPGIYREKFGFHTWLKFRNNDWLPLIKEAKIRRDKGLNKTLPIIMGFDQDKTVLEQAQDNIVPLELDDWLRISNKDVSEITLPSHLNIKNGLLITNPPYGERLGTEENLIPTYQQLGKLMREQFENWQGAVITSNPVLAKQIGIRSHKSYQFYNGALECKLYLFDINHQRFMREFTDE